MKNISNSNFIFLTFAFSAVLTALFMSYKEATEIAHSVGAVYFTHVLSLSSFIGLALVFLKIKKGGYKGMSIAFTFVSFAIFPIGITMPISEFISIHEHNERGAGVLVIALYLFTFIFYTLCGFLNYLDDKKESQT